MTSDGNIKRLKFGDDAEFDRHKNNGVKIKVLGPATETVDGKDATINITDGEFDTFIEIENGIVIDCPDQAVIALGQYDKAKHQEIAPLSIQNLICGMI